jgi:hypothetical protein
MSRTAGRERSTCGCGARGNLALTLPPVSRLRSRFTGEQTSPLMAIIASMSQASSSATPSMPTTTRGVTPDRQALAQVEKWMTIIRELAHERQAPTIIPSDDPSVKA